MIGIWDWFKSRKGEARQVQSNQTPSFETLEPRFLLSADLIDVEPLSCLPPAPDEQAIVVDLNGEDEGAGQVAASTACDCAAGQDGDTTGELSNATSQPVETDLETTCLLTTTGPCQV